VGGRVTLSHTDVRATLISQHDVGGLTHVVMDSSPPCVCAVSHPTDEGLPCGSGGGGGGGGSNASLIHPLHANGLKALKPIRMNYEELTPLLEMHASEAGWWKEVAPGGSSSPPQDTLHSSVARAEIGLALRLLEAGGPSSAPEAPSLEGVFWAQCKSKALKVLDVVLKKVSLKDVVEEMPEILVALMARAVQSDQSEEFLTLEEAELKALALRKRIYQLNHHLGTLGSSDYAAGSGGGAGGRKGGSGGDSGLHAATTAATVSAESGGGGSGGSGRLDLEKLAKGVPSELVEELMVMGFPQEWCILALTENPDDLVSASTWIVDHLDMLSSMDLGAMKAGSGSGSGGNPGGENEGGAGQDRLLDDADSGQENYDFDDEKDNDDDLDDHDNGEGGSDFSSVPPVHMQGPNSNFGSGAAAAGMTADNDDDMEDGSDDDGIIADGLHARQDLLDREGCDSNNGDDADVDEENADGTSDGGAHDHSDAGDEGSDFEDGFPARHKWFTGGAGGGGAAMVESSEAFGEAYFPHDFVPTVSNVGGGEGEGPGAVQNAGHFDVYNYSASVDGMSVRDCVSERAKIKTMLSAVTRLEMSQLIAESMRVEACISILRCRMLLICLFYTWVGDLELSLDHFGGDPQSVLRLCKAICFRGAQFPIPRVSGGWMCEQKRGKFTWETSNGAARLNASGVMEDLVLRLLRAERASSAAVAATTRDADGKAPDAKVLEPTRSMAHSLTVQCISDLEIASQTESDDDECWGFSNQALSDVDAFNEPSICFASWGLQILMEERCPDVFTEEIAHKLVQVSYSSNATARFAALRALRYILGAWNNHRVGSGSSSLAVPVPSNASLKALVKNELRPGRLLNAVRRRIVAERKQGRLYFSHYLQAMIEVCNLAQSLLDVVEAALLSEAGAATALALHQVEMDVLKTAPTRPHLKRNGPCTILLGWSAGSDAPESSTGEFSYTMEMCQVAEYFELKYPYWLNNLYWNIPTD
jgi:hypothetical protein